MKKINETEKEKIKRIKKLLDKAFPGLKGKYAKEKEDSIKYDNELSI